MISLLVDLDNTLIYTSKKLDSLEDMVCVEEYKGKPLSYMTKHTYEALNRLSGRDDLNIIPITTRVDYQYERLNLPRFEFALLANGSVLRLNGLDIKHWSKESEGYSAEVESELKEIDNLLNANADKFQYIRHPMNTFIFAKYNDGESINIDIEGRGIDLYTVGSKFYAIPKKLSKGYSISRLKKFINLGKVISAGDSEIDRTMIDYSDLYITSDKCTGKTNVKVCDSPVFSDDIIRHIENLLS